LAGLKILRRVGLNALLVFIPAAAILQASGVGGLWVFASAALAIIPLASWLGRATEHLASRVGEGLGGFLNATFGNAAEMIIAMAALRKGHVEVVKSSIIGSVLGNLLLVFGLAMLVGGARRPRQTFDRTAAGAGVSMMVVSVVALVIPAIFHLAIEGKSAHGGPPPPPGIEDRLAVDIALVLLLTYGLSLLFAFRTHRRHYMVTEGPAPVEAGHRHWPAKRSFLVLGGATALIVWMSELLVHNIMIHIPHHVEPRIPFYRLKRAYADLQREYGPYLHEYRFRWSTVWVIFRQCQLYDFDTKTWHTYRGRCPG